MIVSWNWLEQYVSLQMPLLELTGRLTMTGLNLEGIQQVDGDTAIDLEVTSNRPDCLGHIGVAREIGVLYETALALPKAQPATISQKTASATSVEIECDDLCPQYFARVIRGIEVGPSPQWLQKRLNTVGIAAINNVVDVTNYVLMETGQPLHAFDFDKLRGRRIVVRRPRRGEKIVAIDHNEYELSAEMCIIADAERPVAIGGVMGGLDTEISDSTVNLLIETADFAPLSIRETARKLNLHSDSSYRFERGVDPGGLAWASRRCCELILETAGGELLEEPVVAGPGRPVARRPINLRFAQIPRILGIDVPAEQAVEILISLGLKQHQAAANGRAQFVAPSWRRDLEREADLIEEIARINGYEKIPDDVSVPLQISSRTRRERVVSAIRHTLIGCGFFEAVTFSLVSEETCRLFRPHGDRPLLRIEHPSWRLDSILRQSLVPSLLQSRRENERQGTFDAELFEIARVYLRAAPDEPDHQSEPTTVALVSGRPFGGLKGVIDALVERLKPNADLNYRPFELEQLVAGRGAEIVLEGRRLGVLGELDRNVADHLDLRDAVTVAEVDLAVLEQSAELIPTFVPLPQYPPIQRDLNFVLDESVTWDDLSRVVLKAAGPLLESVDFGGQYRGRQIGPGQKSYLVELTYRAPDRTLTNEEVETAQASVVEACRGKLKAALRS